MAWRVAKSLETLLAQINELAPNRSKISDGSIGDPAHSSRESDHNPNPAGVVCARDFTHDPAHGADMNDFAEALRESKDVRINYVIWNRRIFSSTLSPWTWRSYTGTNPHDHHMHVSVQQTVSLYDSAKPWELGTKEWDEMATKQEIKDAVREVVQNEIKEAVHDLAVGKKQKGYDPDKVNLKAVLDKK